MLDNHMVVLLFLFLKLAKYSVAHPFPSPETTVLPRGVPLVRSQPSRGLSTTGQWWFPGLCSY